MPRTRCLWRAAGGESCPRVVPRRCPKCHGVVHRGLLGCCRPAESRLIHSCGLPVVWFFAPLTHRGCQTAPLRPPVRGHRRRRPAVHTLPSASPPPCLEAVLPGGLPPRPQGGGRQAGGRERGDLRQRPPPRSWARASDTSALGVRKEKRLPEQPLVTSVRGCLPGPPEPLGQTEVDFEADRRSARAAIAALSRARRASRRPKDTRNGLKATRPW